MRQLIKPTWWPNQLIHQYSKTSYQDQYIFQLFLLSHIWNEEDRSHRAGPVAVQIWGRSILPNFWVSVHLGTVLLGKFGPGDKYLELSQSVILGQCQKTTFLLSNCINHMQDHGREAVPLSILYMYSHIFCRGIINVLTLVCDLFLFPIVTCGFLNFLHCSISSIRAN